MIDTITMPPSLRWTAYVLTSGLLGWLGADLRDRALADVHVRRDPRLLAQRPDGDRVAGVFHAILADQLTTVQRRARLEALFLLVAEGGFERGTRPPKPKEPKRKSTRRSTHHQEKK